MVVLRSDSPRFDQSADSEAEARWEAYQALMRRRGDARVPLDVGNRFEDEDGAAWPAEPGDDIGLRRAGSATPSSRRVAGFVVATMALTAGVITAVMLVQRQRAEPAAPATRPQAPAAARLVAPPRAAAPSDRPMALAMSAIKPQAVASDRPATPLAAATSSHRVGGAHGRPPSQTPQAQTPQCWTTELSTGLDPRSLVREARLVNCPLPW